VAAERHVGGGMVAALRRAVSRQEGADVVAAPAREHALDELVVAHAARGGLAHRVVQARPRRARLRLDPGAVRPLYHDGVRAHRAVPLVYVARHGEVAVVVVHLHHAPARLSLAAALGAPGLAAPEDQVQAVARGGHLGVGAGLLDHPAVLSIQHSIDDHVVEVEPREGAVGPEDEPHAVAAPAADGRHGIIEARPGRRVGALGHAPGVRVHGQLGRPAVPPLAPPAHPARLAAQLLGDACQRAP
jgi:hypothetical protein